LGKPYQQELASLPETYSWVLDADIAPVVSALTASAQKPLVAVGSGGSLSVAEFTASLHQDFTDKLAKAATPLEIITAQKRDFGASFFLFSAGGGNKDTLQAFRHLAVLEPHRLVVLTARSASRVVKLADRFPYVDKLELPLPCGKDGFLATNSLLAFCVVMARAYATVFQVQPSIPKSLEELLTTEGQDLSQYQAKLERKCRLLWQRENLVILHSPSVIAAARDLESRFTEAALGPVQIADFRQFAHGRHHWLAKRGNSSAVLSLVAENDSALAAKTLRLLPKHIPAVQLDFSGQLLRSALQALCTGIFVAGLAGKARAIDPGRPGVPSFGRKIYNLGPTANARRNGGRIAAAVARKIAGLAGTAINESVISIWDGHYRLFMSKLRNKAFGGLVLDYDGTLCADRYRFTGPESEIIKAVVGLLQKDIPVGIATGRGDSVRRDLKKCIPAKLQDRVLVGYYNGSQLGLLSDDTQPESMGMEKSLSDFSLVLNRDAHLEQFAKCSVSTFQISIRPHPTTALECVWSVLWEARERANVSNVRFVCSAHSIDILSASVSKLRVLEALRETHKLKPDTAILCIGDRGRWPGNDYELLSTPHSLSVEEVSTAPDTCWNLAQWGHRGSKALLDYLAAIRIHDGSFRVDTRKIAGGINEG
jgi:hypothetical protein